MDNVILLLLDVPESYFRMLFHPFNAGPFSLIIVGGILCLAAGVILCFYKWKGKLLLFAIPFVASELFSIVSYLCRGKLRHDAAGQWLLLFLIMQAVIIGYLVYLLKGTRAAASLLAVFSVSYALFTAFVAGMSFMGTWL